jgi:uncharacterized integral membrane protein
MDSSLYFPGAVYHRPDEKKSLGATFHVRTGICFKSVFQGLTRTDGPACLSDAIVPSLALFFNAAPA